ncbi:MAG: hypothetical protein V3U96_01455 [Paracoccaceae bacterium]
MNDLDEIAGEHVYVVHFSTSLANDHEIYFPDNLKHVLENPTQYCLCASAFTQTMLANGIYALQFGVGLIIETALEQNEQFTDTCCSYGGGRQIRAASNGDLGSNRVEPPCIPIDSIVSRDDIRNSLAPPANGHNEWVVKPPHNILGIFMNGINPKVQVLGIKNGNREVPAYKTTDLKEIRKLFYDLPVWIFNDGKVTKQAP